MHQNAQEMPAYLQVFVGAASIELNSRGQLVVAFWNIDDWRDCLIICGRR